jgi:hypothetical protein
MTNGSDIGPHTVEILHHIEGVHVVNGGWVRGYTWFGSIMTTLEVKNRNNVASNCIIKSNHISYPMEALYAIMKG